VLCLTHGLGSASYYQVCDACLNPHCSVNHGLEPRAAPAIQLQARNLVAEAGIQGSYATDGRGLAVGVTLAEKHIIHIGCGEPSPADELLHHRSGQISCRHIPQGSAITANWGSQWFADNCLAHGVCLMLS
jgi:hypothetical protein